MRELPQHVVAKVSGPVFEQLRRQFVEVGRLLLNVSPDADCQLMTSYVKFTAHAGPQSRVFAVAWYKNSKRLVVGFALPEEYEAEELGPALPGTVYKGLTKYCVVEQGAIVPPGLVEWARLAYRNVLHPAVCEDDATSRPTECVAAQPIPRLGRATRSMARLLANS
jgi:hypothetical protein